MTDIENQSKPTTPPPALFVECSGHNPSPQLVLALFELIPVARMALTALDHEPNKTVRETTAALIKRRIETAERLLREYAQ